MEVEKVATPEGWRANPALVLDFYNARRQAVRAAEPNAAHRALVELERAFEVAIVTQNIDDLHERAGSRQVLHLHGNIMKARSTADEDVLYDLGEKDIHLGDCCEFGSQLRPHVVWFGEAVPAMEQAADLVRKADIFIIVGSSLVVYPAASLRYFTSPGSKMFLVDLDPPVSEPGRQDIEVITAPATVGVPALVQRLLSNASPV